jgi:UDP-N-acetylglucosamine--N-acetylmuramyl-(pentapeptide) pyrophosphoryl-undecaprenol N-acetylglucosamine transferase
MADKYRILIAGGGTGGHLFPSIAIGTALKNNGFDICYVGSKFGIESNIFGNQKEPYYLLNIRGIQRSLSFRSLGINLLFPFRFIYSYLKSRKIIKSFSPDVVVGTGGYASGLPLLVATQLNIKTLIQEQNSYPGMVTRNLSKKINTICIAFEDAKSYLPNSHCILTGNPVRNNITLVNKISAKKNLGLDINKQTIFITGGSQGSRPINNHFKSNHKLYTDAGIQLLWQCGALDYEELKLNIDDNNIILTDFIDDMATAYSCADLVISRAGALAIAELSSVGKATILIPFPHAAGNHQLKNAQSLSTRNATILIEQSTLKTGILEKTAIDVINNEKQKKELQKEIATFESLNASSIIIKEIEKLI